MNGLNLKVEDSQWCHDLKQVLLVRMYPECKTVTLQWTH